MSTSGKKILIVSVSIGSGHEQAARAVSAAIKRQYPWVEINVVDFMAVDNSYLNKLVKETYLKMLDFSPDMYELLFRWTQVPWQGSNVRNILVRAMKRSMLGLIKQYQPDFVICTHPFPCGAAAYLRCKGKLGVPVMGIITDFTAHRLWLYDEVDTYCVAVDEIKETLLAEGIKREKIYVTGIPIAAEFTLSVDKEAIRQEFGLLANKPVVLIMGGGLGLGNVKKTLLELNKVPNIFSAIIVAGHNSELKQSLVKLAKDSSHQTIVLGYSKRIPELMASSDLLITKPGGMTLSEALVRELPMLLCQALPGQEEDNAAYLTGKGAALWACDEKEFANKVSVILNDLDKLVEMRAAAKGLRHPKAAEEIANIIGSKMNLSNQ